MALSQQQLSELTAWVDQFALATNDLSRQTAAAVLAAFTGLNYYQASAVLAAAEQAADQSHTSTLLAAGLLAQYLSLTIGQMVGSPVGIPNLPLSPIRNGVSLTIVFDRVAKLYRRKIAAGVPADQALAAALRYAAALVDANIRLAQRDYANQVLSYLADQMGITGYRRVVRPELSRTGTCGLCLIASDKVYKTGDLLPLHDNCQCVVLPIIGDTDPGDSMNNLSLADIYAAAGSNNGRKLKRVRYQVNQHGELGPVLTDARHKFTSPAELEGYDPRLLVTA